MPRRSKEELRAEFDRLSDIFELFLEFERSRMSEAEAAEHRSLIHTREKMLTWVEDGIDTMSGIIAGTRQAINDNNEMLTDCAEVGDPFFPEFLAFYKEKTGRDYYDDAGNPKKMARKIFKRGEISDETEFYLIMGVVNNVEQTVFNSDETVRVNQMLFQFENAVRRSLT